MMECRRRLVYETLGQIGCKIVAIVCRLADVIEARRLRTRLRADVAAMALGRSPREKILSAMREALKTGFFSL